MALVSGFESCSNLYMCVVDAVACHTLSCQYRRIPCLFLFPLQRQKDGYCKSLPGVLREICTLGTYCWLRGVFKSGTF